MNEIEEFEYTINMAKLRALSKVSLERELTDSEFDTMMKLKDMVLE